MTIISGIIFPVNLKQLAEFGKTEENEISDCTVQNLFNRFKSGDLSFEINHRSSCRL